ncbi:MAG TPA: TonB-dependent receptor, partial [Terriglobales bacterium]|nr:TonB-dependent receptor [Terriglobales bacterium]
MIRTLAVVGLSLLFTCISGLAQSSSGTSGMVRGTVLDASGAAIPRAAVDIRNPVSGYTRNTVTDSQGRFQFDNLPFNPYHVSGVAPNFQASEQDVDVKSAIPIQIKFTLKVGESSTSVAVTAEGKDLIELDPVAHTDVDRGLFEKLPLESQSSSLSSLVTLSAPGVSADSNGLFHGFGDHASNSFSVDGQKITDQQSKVFSNQIPLDSVQSMEVIQGAPPAEYGDKTSLVIVVTTRSGLGVDHAHGEVTGSYGTFGTGSGGLNLAYGGKSWGNFISASGMDTGRFLDGPEFAVMHDHGNQGNVFDRIDFKPSQSDTININLGYTRSWFQTPNSYDGQYATAWSGVVVDNGGLGPDGQVVGPQDQRSKINTFNIAPTWTHLINAHTLFTLGGYVRQDQFNYYPSANPFSDLTGDLQSETVGQNRTLTNIGGHADLSYVNGIHNIKTGISYDHTFLTEKDRFGIVDPTLNPVCLNADGSPFTDPSVTDPAGCIGDLQPNPAFVPQLGCIDLTRTGTLPGSDGCPNSTAGLYNYRGHADIKELALYFQDNITIRNWTFNLGLRGDIYNGLASAKQIEPRLGIA